MSMVQPLATTRFLNIRGAASPSPALEAGDAFADEGDGDDDDDDDDDDSGVSGWAHVRNPLVEKDTADDSLEVAQYKYGGGADDEAASAEDADEDWDILDKNNNSKRIL